MFKYPVHITCELWLINKDTVRAAIAVESDGALKYLAVDLSRSADI
jgi:hypothetical protein